METEADSRTAAIETYLAAVGATWKTGVATEHSYRGALQELLSALLPGVSVVNEPKRVECGAPDYILARRGLPVAFVEAKDIGDDDLDGARKSGHREQFNRYKASLGTLAFTDYLDFRLWLHGEPAGAVRIGEVRDGRVVPLPANYPGFLALVEMLGQTAPRKISSASQLAVLMAGKARLLCDVARRLLARDGYTGDPAADALVQPRSAVGRLLAVFRRVLVPNTTSGDFADIYAQTLVYGMFAARLHDDTPQDFSRWEAAALVPKSNPFLKKLFAHLASNGDPDADWIVDDIVALFAASDVRRILRDYGRATGQRDPMIHFYEDFLDAYDPAARKKRGVWYTPLPVVQFIVRAADTLLASRFDFPDGLADRARTTVPMPDGPGPVPRIVPRSIPRIQVLDPATGTGTFLAECVNRIHAKFEGNEGLWPGYVRSDLVPRLNGFELLMASYTMAHVKLDLALAATGYTQPADSRFNVFLTDSLRDGFSAASPLLFAEELSDEANAANFVKNSLPVMVVLGNPPYNANSENNGEWIMGLLDDYKVEPGGQRKLSERKNWLNDDYVKFIRLAEHFIERNKSGIVAFINPHGFLDNPTFRGMRWHLMQTFDEIYVLDLHGNSKKKETAPDGSKDENVFEIMQGVSINFFVKHKPSHSSCRVYHADLWGKRTDKFAILESSDLFDIQWRELRPTMPMCFFVPKDTAGEAEYNKGFRIDELMPVNTSGFASANDSLNFSFTEAEQRHKIAALLTLAEHDWRTCTGRVKDSRDWRYATAKADAETAADRFLEVAYRPFDVRHTCYTGKSRGLYASPQQNVMHHFLSGDNLGLCCIRICSRDDDLPVFVTTKPTDKTILSPKDNANVFPLFLYEETLGVLEKRPNLAPSIISEIAAKIGRDPSPEESFDWVYGVLHTPEYRERYAEFLKVDFPRVPYPADGEEFAEVARLGRALRECHLMQDPGPSLSERTAAFPVAGACRVEKAEYADGKVWINDTQHFANVDAADWNAWIGGYQPAQKWLKDRKGRTLSPADLQHYRRIILALRKTRALMSDLSALWRSRRTADR